MKLWIDRDYNGYQLELDREETSAWANRPNSAWPTSSIEGHELRLTVDTNGLCEISEPMLDIDESELYGIVSDHLPPVLRHLWPVWQKET
jgi:hypothetical protein